MNGLQISRDKAQKLVEQFDVDKDGVIDVKEFEAPLASPRPVSGS